MAKKTKQIFIFAIITRLTTRKLSIRVSREKACKEDGSFNWDHLMEIGARRLGRTLKRDMFPDSGNFNLKYRGWYLSEPKPKKPPKKGKPMQMKKVPVNKKPKDETLSLFD